MAQNNLNTLLSEQLKIADAARNALEESFTRAKAALARSAANPGGALAVEDRETLEALTARFARLSDMLFQRLFRTIDQLELCDDGSNIDRLNRMESRGVIASAALWRDLRQVRNDIVHEYLIEASDQVVHQSITLAPELFETLNRLTAYSTQKGFVS
ncbi:MAG: hypothetical protein A2583_02180 [Bdellovibrionales bacterium RIFOXYD1_FULL_53_11]|nr:MAG: hypothetical protein A2583_02180 [Bdellovibrionales bacterium RIFOXYD1_FULL_53_11]